MPTRAGHALGPTVTRESEMTAMSMLSEAPVFPAHDMAPRILLGPGPDMVHPRVTAAMSAPLVGHLDPDFLVLMDRTQHLLRYAFQTQNRLTLPVSGTGSAGRVGSSGTYEGPILGI